MANKIQIRRGIKANLPILSAGEPAFCTDTKQLFLGTGSGNIEYTKQSDVNIINSQLNEKVNKTAIINNCNVTEEGFIADARQLKYLFDLITKINNTTSYTTDLNIEKSIISKYNSNTLNTPYKQGLVTAGIGVCLTFMDGELQIAFPYMDNKILMRNSKGTWVKVSA